MVSLASIDKCTGCAACFNSCPKHAIIMKADKEGFLFPVINADKCVQCNLCVKNCPVLSDSSFFNDECPRTFAVWSYPDRQLSSSGGAFSAFARLILSRKGVVFGAMFDENLQVKHTEVHTVEDLVVLRGSKYVQSNIENSFANVKHYLDQNIPVLFVGTPCQIDGLKRFLRKPYDSLLTLDLVCHGVPSNALFQSYLAKLKKHNSKYRIIDDFEFRCRNGWYKASAVVRNGKSMHLYEIDNLYMCAFDKSALFRNSCYSCKYATLPRVGDCTIADFWGIGCHGTSFKHNVLKGVSLVFGNNSKGLNALKSLTDTFIEERDLGEALIENMNLKHASLKHLERDAIIQAFLDEKTTLASINQTFHLVDHSLKNIIKKYALKYHVFDIVKRIYCFYKSL